jgi:hypothetical protein
VTVLIAHPNKHDDQFRVNGLPRHIVSALITNDRCPMCLGRLDQLLVCTKCKYEGDKWLGASTADYNRAYDRREP